MLHYLLLVLRTLPIIRELFFSFSYSPCCIPSGSVGFIDKRWFENVPRWMLTHTKKAWHFFAFIGTFEVFDYLNLPITTSKAHAGWRERRRFTLGDYLKVSKFQRFQCISYFAFIYSMVCINELCGFSHKLYVWWILISLLFFRLIFWVQR